MSIKYVLPSSKKVLVKDGKVNTRVISNLMKEAYNLDGLYAECRIQRKMEDGRVSDASYKEFWDCYRSVTGKEDFDPYDKKHPFSLGKAFAVKKHYESFLDSLHDLSNLVVGEANGKNKESEGLEAEIEKNKGKSNFKYNPDKVVQNI